MGVEPTQSTAAAAKELGITVIEDFFGEALAKELPKSDLVVGNNFFAHVPDINDFSKGLARCLKPQGVVTLDFPHLLTLVLENQFDTVYHEHFSYLSLLSADQILNAAGLRIFDVEQLSTHGGSLRIYACLQSAEHAQTEAQDPPCAPTEREADRDERIGQVLAKEVQAETVQDAWQHEEDDHGKDGNADQLFA